MAGTKDQGEPTFPAKLKPDLSCGDQPDCPNKTQKLEVPDNNCCISDLASQGTKKFDLNCGNLPDCPNKTQKLEVLNNNCFHTCGFMDAGRVFLRQNPVNVKWGFMGFVYWVNYVNGLL
ncbi:hypothetical protein ACFX2I_024502 [Malus domestica]